MHYTVSYAKTHLSLLIRLAESGEDVVVTRRGKAVVRILPLDTKKTTAEEISNLPQNAQNRENPADLKSKR
jgi:prevent-host-death family protein